MMTESFRPENAMRYRLVLLGCFVLISGSAAVNPPEKPTAKVPVPPFANLPQGWSVEAPREKLRPKFEFEPRGGFDGAGAFTINADSIEGQHGWFEKSLGVTGGKYYRFYALRKVTGVEVPRKSVY